MWVGVSRKVFRLLTTENDATVLIFYMLGLGITLLIQYICLRIPFVFWWKKVWKNRKYTFLEVQISERGSKSR